jgi:hypothetical protein
MNGHTQGPWGPISDEFGDCEMGVAWPGDSRGHFLAVAQSGDPDELRANARLIAAAPELLDALQHALERLECIPGDRDETGVILHSINKARAAIARATGDAA